MLILFLYYIFYSYLFALFYQNQKSNKSPSFVFNLDKMLNSIYIKLVISMYFIYLRIVIIMRIQIIPTNEI